MDNDGEKDIGNKFERQRYCFCMRYAAISDNYLLIIVDVIKHLHFSSTVVVKYHIISTIYYDISGRMDIYIIIEWCNEYYYRSITCVCNVQNNVLDCSTAMPLLE